MISTRHYSNGQRTEKGVVVVVAVPSDGNSRKKEHEKL